jgi:hypothetical protein
LQKQLWKCDMSTIEYWREMWHENEKGEMFGGIEWKPQVYFRGHMFVKLVCNWEELVRS